MFRETRRKKQVLSPEECESILKRGEWGVLGLHGDDGYPYTVPLNYAFHNGIIYFHSARAGHKIDALERNDKATFCVVDKSDLLPEDFATAYQSVIVFGRIRKVTDGDESLEALHALVEALAGQVDEASKHAEVDSCRMRENVEVLALEPEHVSGKRAKSMTSKRGGQHPEHP